MTFTERLARRNDAWWGRRVRWNDPRTVVAALHARRDFRARRSANDPDEIWRCCPQWPRKLLNKWNAREYAISHGAPVPGLMGFVASASAISFDALPEAYAIRPVRSAMAKGAAVVVGDRELLHAMAASDVPDFLRSQRGSMAGPYLIEEFNGTTDGRLPVEYKVHTFAGTVAAVQVNLRLAAAPRDRLRSYYRPDWTLFEEVMDTADPPAPPQPKPAALPEMVDVAARLSNSIGTYMRVDFLAGEAGTLFNEFSSVPSGGSPHFTPFCDDHFGRIWEQACPETT